MSKLIDLTGQRFGFLTVEEVVRINGARKWKCQCDCGNIVYFDGCKLRAGRATSCGLNCSLKITKNHANFKGNKFSKQDDYYIGKDAKGNEFYIDVEDYEAVSEYCWTGQDGERQAVGGKYFCARMSRKSLTGHQMKMLQNFIWEFHFGKIPDGYRVDHINLLPKDNRLDNLRLVTKSMNAFNCMRKNKSNTGIVGVMKVSDDAKYHAGKWRAYISFDGTRKELGYFNDKDTAILKRLTAELEYFHEICPDNRAIYEKYKEFLNDK